MPDTVEIEINENITEVTLEVSNNITEVELIVQEGTVGVRGPQGYSAYQIAVQNGFVGTEPEWLLSLKSTGGGSDRFVVIEDMLFDSGATLAHPDFAGKVITGFIIDDTPVNIRYEQNELDDTMVTFSNREIEADQTITYFFK